MFEWHLYHFAMQNKEIDKETNIIEHRNTKAITKRQNNNLLELRRCK